jgi:hypothetical protein
MASTKRRAKHFTKRAGFKAGEAVVCTDGSLEGTDPFTKLKVLVVHPNGKLDVARDDNLGTIWTGVNARSLTKVS